MEEMLKSKWSGRVWVGINKSSTYNSVQRHCWTLHAVAAKSCCYNGHDARPNPTLDELVHPSGNAAWLNSTT